jgi:hypothetical protein
MLLYREFMLLGPVNLASVIKADVSRSAPA